MPIIAIHCIAANARRWRPCLPTCGATAASIFSRLSAPSIWLRTHRHAEVVAYVAMGGVPMDSVETAVSVKADLYRFDVQLVQGEDDWLITRARWQRAPAELFAL